MAVTAAQAAAAAEHVGQAAPRPECNRIVMMRKSAEITSRTMTMVLTMQNSSSARCRSLDDTVFEREMARSDLPFVHRREFRLVLPALGELRRGHLRVEPAP
jgi:hypothetical protein